MGCNRRIIKRISNSATLETTMKRIAFVLFLVSTILMTAFAQTTQTKPVVHKKVPVKPAGQACR